MPRLSQKSLLISLAILAGIVLVANLVLAWTTPTADPPASNIPAPINEGSDTQTKSGGLNISGNVGIGTTTPSDLLTVNGNINVLGNEVTNLAAPTADDDAATKAYVDAHSGSLSCTVYSKDVGYGGTVYCGSGTLTGGGCLSDGYDGTTDRPNGNGWECDGGNSYTAYAICCKIE